MAKPSLGDDLDRPLGTRLNAGRSRKLPYGRLALAGAVTLTASLAAFVYVRWDGSAGRGIAVAPVELAAPAPIIAGPPAPEAAVATARTQAAPDSTGSMLPSRSATVAEIESRSGVKVTRPAGAVPSGALIIEVPPDAGIRLTPAPDPRLVEKSAHGVLPKIGRDGSRPADVYSRPVVMPASLKAGAPRIAILVGGMGLSPTGTAKALAELPSEITLGFAPYGSELEKLAAQARDDGHEIMLQVPMEPFDYPANNPGPQTLLTSDAPAQNVARLRWQMSRFVGYVGIVNFLGGKFTALPQALRPVLQEVADRGLIYADDGTSTRSAAEGIAASLSLPMVHTDVVIDAVQRPDAIDAALAELEGKARATGFAVGSATGLPITIERIARWSHGLEKRGVALVPISAAAGRQRDLAADGAQNGR